MPRRRGKLFPTLGFLPQREYKSWQPCRRGADGCSPLVELHCGMLDLFKYRYSGTHRADRCLPFKETGVEASRLRCFLSQPSVPMPTSSCWQSHTILPLRAEHRS